MTPTLAARLQAATIAVEAPLVYRCKVCEARLEPVEFSDGGSWSVRGLAMRGRRRFKSTLCFDCYMTACRSALKTWRD
jgi:hypothetical protein